MENTELWLQSLPTHPVDEEWKRRFAQRLSNQQKTGKVLWGGLGLGLAILLGLKAQPYLQKLRPGKSDLPRQVFHLKVNPLVELDGKSKAEILKLRSQALSELPDLGPLWHSEEPLERSRGFKAIADGQRWLGLQGQLQANNDNYAERFHEGESEQSFFIRNPMALVGLQSCLVCQQNDRPGKLEGARRELVPASVTLDGAAQELDLTYQIGRDSPVRDRMSDLQVTHLLNVVNAHEMGFRYFAIESSSGFTRVPGLKLFECIQFWTPRQLRHGTEVANELYIRTVSMVPVRLESLPAQLKIKLWRQQPEKLTDPADLTEIIHVVE